MRVYINPADDIFAAKSQAKHALKAIAEYGCKPKQREDGSYIDGADWFEIELPRTMTHEGVEQLLAAVGARGVSVQQPDLRNFSSDPYEQSVIGEMIEKKLVDADYIPTDDLTETVTGWRAAAWMDKEQMSEAEEQAAYDEIVKRLPAEDLSLSSAPNDDAPRASSGSLRELLDEADEFLREHAAENPGVSYEPSAWAARRQG